MLGPRNAAVVEYRVALDGGGYAWVWAERLRAQAAEDAAEDAEVLCMQGEWQQLRCRCLFTMAPLFDPARGRSCTHLPMCNYDALCRCVPCLLRRCRHSPIVERTAWPCPPAGTLESPAPIARAQSWGATRTSAASCESCGRTSCVPRLCSSSNHRKFSRLVCAPHAF